VAVSYKRGTPVPGLLWPDVFLKWPHSVSGFLKWPHSVSGDRVSEDFGAEVCEDRVLDGPASGGKGSKGRN